MLLLSLLSLLRAPLHEALYTGKFESLHWTPGSCEDKSNNESSQSPITSIQFIFALNVVNASGMHDELMLVSNPKSESYGRYLSHDDIHTRFGISANNKAKVLSYFESTISDAVARCSDDSDLCTVSANIGHIEAALRTELHWHCDARGLSSRSSIRASRAINIAKEIEPFISFISLNSPINHLMPRGSKYLSGKSDDNDDNDNTRSESNNLVKKAKTSNETTYRYAGITTGNDEVLAHFVVYCGDGQRNTVSPPCSDRPDVSLVPSFAIFVTTHANNVSDPHVTSSKPMTFLIDSSDVYCYNVYNSATCSGIDGKNCTCLTKV